MDSLNRKLERLLSLLLKAVGSLSEEDLERLERVGFRIVFDDEDAPRGRKKVPSKTAADPAGAREAKAMLDRTDDPVAGLARLKELCPHRKQLDAVARLLHIRSEKSETVEKLRQSIIDKTISDRINRRIIEGKGQGAQGPPDKPDRGGVAEVEGLPPAPQPDQIFLLPVTATSEEGMTDVAPMEAVVKRQGGPESIR